MSLSDQQRLQGLTRWLEKLRQRCEVDPILVEGRHDLQALRALGLVGRIEIVNQGRTLPDLALDLARGRHCWVLLTDRDRRGGTLARTLDTLLRSSGSRTDHQERRALFRWAEISQVEQLPVYLQTLQERVAGQDRYARRRVQD